MEGGLAQSPQKTFWPFGPQFALKIRGGGVGALALQAPPLDPPLGRWAVSQECLTIRTFSSPINVIPCPEPRKKSLEIRLQFTVKFKKRNLPYTARPK